MADQVIQIKLTGDATGATNATKTVRRELDDLNKSTTTAGRALDQLKSSLASLGAAAALGALVKSSLDAALQMERLNRQFEVFAGSASLAARELAFIRNEANRLGLDTLSLTTQYGQFLNAVKGTANEGERGRRAFIGLSEGMAAIGMNAEMQGRAWAQLNQGIMKGKFEMEDLKSINEAGLPIFKLMADALGVTTGKLLEMQSKGQILVEDVLPKLGESMHQAFGQAAVNSAESAQGAINRMNNAILEAKSALGAALIPAFTDAVKAGTPFLNLIKEFIGGLQILAIKAAAIPDRLSAMWQVIKSGKGLFSKDGSAMWDSLSNPIDANVDETIADLMKRYTPQGSDYTANELAKQSLNKPSQPPSAGASKAADDVAKWASTYAQLRKEIAALNPIMSEHDKKLLDVSAKYAELERKKGANIATLQKLKAEHLQAIETAYQTAEAIKATSREFAEYLRIAGDESAWSQTAESVDDYHKKFRESVEDMDAATKAARDVANGIYDIERAFAEAGQSTAIETFINNLFKLKDVQNSTADINISMADSDPAAQQMAAIEERYRRETELIQQRLDALAAANLTETAMYQALSDNILAMASKREQDIANIQRQQSEEGWQSVVGAAQKAFPKLTGLDKAVTAAFKDHTKYRLATEQERAAGAQKLVKDETRSNLSMYSSYAGAAGAVFEGLAATQDTTSRAGFETAKAFNIAAAVMNTAMAITNALATVQPYPAAVAAAAMAGVMGAIQIATIASTTFGGTAQAPSIPSGSFAASAGGGAASSTIGSQIAYVQDPYAMAATEALQGLANAAASASLALGDVSKIYDKVGESFSTDKGQALAERGAWMIASSGAKNAAAAINAVKSDPQLIEGISMYFQDALKAMNVGALALGLNAQAINPAIGRNTTGWEWGDWRSGKTTADVAKGLQEILEIHMANFAAGWGNELLVYAKPFENASEAIQRLSTALYTFNDAAELAGITLMEGLAGGNWASAIIENIGGLEDFNTAMDSYFDAMFTSAEQDAMEAAKATREVTREFSLLAAAGINLEMPKTREEFRALVEGLDLMSGAGATAFSSLIKISEAFGTMMDAADEAAAKLKEIQSATQDLDVRYLQATGQDAAADTLSRQLSAQREIEQAIADNMGDAYINRLREVLALEEQATANSSAAAALKASQDAAAAALADAANTLKNSFAAEKKILTDAYNAELALLNSNMAAAKTVVSDITGYVNKLASARKSMTLEDEAYQRSQHAAAKAMLAATLVAARGGDLSGIANMDEQLSILTKQGANAYANSTDYQRDFWQTSNSISELERLAGNQLTDAEQSVVLAQQQIDLLKTNHDAQLAAMDSQLNAMLGINTSVLALADAINQYQSASAAVKAASAASIIPVNADPIAHLYQTILGRAPEKEGYVYWTQQMQAGAALADIAASFFDSPEYKALNSYAVGTSFVPYNMAANIHQGEMVIDRQSADIMRRYGIPARGSADNRELVAEVRSLRSELRAAHFEIAKNTQKTARYIERWDGDGLPEERAAA